MTTEAPNPWKDAVEYACIINHLPVFEDDPLGTLRNLISWEAQMATDIAIGPLQLQAIEEFKLTYPRCSENSTVNFVFSWLIRRVNNYLYEAEQTRRKAPK